LSEPLRREPCEFAEFHCLLARTDVLTAIGPLDEAFMTAREVEDLSIRVRRQGGEVWFEPASEVTFLPPSTVRWSEVGFLSRRWGERANRQSFEHFLATYGLDRSHMSAIGFANGQRRPIFGQVRRAVGRLGVPRFERAVDYGLHLIERRVNRQFVRPGRTTY
jgi:hypothetical protein